MQLSDNIRTGRFKPEHAILAGGIETLPEYEDLSAEYRITRFEPPQIVVDQIEAIEDDRERSRAWQKWVDENRDSAYLTTRCGAATLYEGTIVNEGALTLWEGFRDGITGNDLYDNSNTELVISNVTGSPAYTDTTVANELDRENMDTGFPLIPGETQGTATAADREFVVRSTYGATSANGDWRRFWVVNSAGGSDEIIDNFSSNQGTKVSGQVWELSVTLRLT